MNSSGDFSVPEELLSTSPHARQRHRSSLRPVDAARWATALLVAAFVMEIARGAIALVVLVAAALLSVFAARHALSTVPMDVRRNTVAGLVGAPFAGFLAGAVAGSAIDEAQGRGVVDATALVAIIGGLTLVAYVRTSQREQTTRAVLPAVQGAALEIRNLDFAYGSQQVLFDVSLTVMEGEIAALLGTNGAGKSTILRSVAGLDAPVGGTIRLFGDDTTYRDAEDVLRRGVALLAGGRMTFPSLTVDENLRVGAYTQGRAAVDEVYQRFPALASRREQRAGTLSGGEQQMLALGRVLLTHPRLLLIDELTLGLAPKVIEELIGTVREVNARGTTVILVEQSVNLALTLAAHSFFLERGEVRFDGPTEELLQRDDLLRPVFLADASS